MAFFVVDHMLGHSRRHPYVDVESQCHVDLRDGDDRVRGIGLLRLPANAGIGEEFGIAFRVFSRRQGWHAGRRRGRVKRVVRKSNRLFVDSRDRSFRQLSPR